MYLTSQAVKYLSRSTIEAGATWFDAFTRNLEDGCLQPKLQVRIATTELCALMQERVLAVQVQCLFLPTLFCTHSLSNPHYGADCTAGITSTIGIPTELALIEVLLRK